MLEEEEDGAFFGKLFHEIMKELYEPYIGKLMTKKDFDEISDKANINSAKQRALKKVFGLKSQNELNRYESKLIVDIVLKYIESLLNFDRQNCPFTLISLEKKHSYLFKLTESDSPLEVRISGIIDRVDLQNGYYRVLDYKTGKIEKKLKSLDLLFSLDRKIELNTITQILLYSLMVSAESDIAVCPGILNINELSDDYVYNICVEGKNIERFNDNKFDSEFKLGLLQCFKNLMSKEGVFTRTENIKTCEYCPYKIICDR